MRLTTWYTIRTIEERKLEAKYSLKFKGIVYLSKISILAGEIKY